MKFNETSGAFAARICRLVAPKTWSTTTAASSTLRFDWCLLFYKRTVELRRTLCHGARSKRLIKLTVEMGEDEARERAHNKCIEPLSLSSSFTPAIIVQLGTSICSSSVINASMLLCCVSLDMDYQLTCTFKYQRGKWSNQSKYYVE